MISDRHDLLANEPGSPVAPVTPATDFKGTEPNQRSEQMQNQQLGPLAG
jgi:hypothetical protein